MPEKKPEVFTLDGIRMLAEIMKANDVSNLDLKQGEVRLKLSRDSGLTHVVAVPQNVPTLPSQPVAIAPHGAEPVALPSPASETKASDAKLKTISSPMVGTFYVAPKPDAAPYVKVGDRVSAQTTVCIIEAMKILNEINAECSGTIVEVLVENGSPVEFGTPLFKVDEN
ncbi:MAG: acetyl-CoA carboxylase biotin carboxyl carrier protein [Planctomycetia bacterium]|nr:acetyl-CoA carboxylase biotin carboxyl carrier protein [Planctomycetia bacterium]